MHVGTRQGIQGQGLLGTDGLRHYNTDCCRIRHGSKCLMFQNKAGIIFHDVNLMCHESHFIQRMYFFYKRMIQTWVRKYEGDEYTDQAKEQYLRKLETKITRKELLYIFKLAGDPGYIIPHIDAGRFGYKTGQPTQEDSAEDELQWIMLEAEEGDCAILANKETRRKLQKIS